MIHPRALRAFVGPALLLTAAIANHNCGGGEVPIKCGASECTAETEYCLYTLDCPKGTTCDTYACLPVPAACNGVGTCACVGTSACPGGMGKCDDHATAALVTCSTVATP